MSGHERHGPDPSVGAPEGGDDIGRDEPRRWLIAAQGETTVRIDYANGAGVWFTLDQGDAIAVEGPVQIRSAGERLVPEEAAGDADRADDRPGDGHAPDESVAPVDH